ncbi:hypothetical protein BDQ17DRAFT_780463 [Cyathus striatus]|nr:hypothetical protein BDQ17DRAFT_780463 [Cyathus striatus]
MLEGHMGTFGNISTMYLDMDVTESQIIDFLEFVYPTPNVRPSYVCIDKACMVLRHLITSCDWNIWKTTTRFVVDSFHYINHRVGDYLCCKFCNPSPLNGSAPNLVLVERDAEEIHTINELSIHRYVCQYSIITYISE